MYPSLDLFPAGEQLLQAFSWTLIHSLWQGLLLAVTAAALLQLMKKARPALRYNIIFIHLLVFISACITTFVRALNTSASQPAAQVTTHVENTGASLFNLDTDHFIQLAGSCSAFVSQHAHILVMLWALFFTFRSFRMVQGLLYLRKARRTQIYGIPEEWRSRFRQLTDSLYISRPVLLLESGFVRVPVVIGHLKPVILMPAGLLTGLPMQQVEAVLLHELAHIRRHDYVINLIQTICETIFFFNPALLWLSSLLRDEREHCCDDIALQQTGNKKEFIQALISFKEHTLYHHHAAVAFPGKKNQLLQRVSRIISNKHQPPGAAEKVCFMAGILLLAVMRSAATITKVSSKPSVRKEITHPDTKVTTKQTPAIIATRHDNGETSDTIPGKNKQSSPTLPALIPPTVIKVTSAPNPMAAAEPEPPVVAEIHAPYEGTGVDVNEEETADMHLKQTRRLQQKAEAPSLRRAKEAEGRRLQHLEKAKGLHEQAILDRIQADKDRAQAERDRVKADIDRQQADRDRVQADKDRRQADADRKQAALDRQRAEKERQQFEADRIQYEKDKKQYEQDRMQYESDRVQANADNEHNEKVRRNTTFYQPGGTKTQYHPNNNYNYTVKPI